MSQQYRRFKQTFLKQHPSSTQHHQQHYSSSNNYDDLRIQNQSHFPFQQMQQGTFGQLGQEQFNMNTYKLNVHPAKHYKQKQQKQQKQQKLFKEFQYDKIQKFKNYQQAESKYEYVGGNYAIPTDKSYNHIIKNNNNNNNNNNKNNKYENIDSKYIPPGRQTTKIITSPSTRNLITTNNNRLSPNNSRQNSRLRVSPSKQLPIVYQNNQHISSSSLINQHNRLVSTSFTGSNSRVLIPQQQMVGQNNIIPVNNVVVQGGQGGGISHGSRVLVQPQPQQVQPQQQQLQHIQGHYIINPSTKIPHNGHINFQISSPVSPRIMQSPVSHPPIQPQIPIPTRILTHSQPQQPMISRRQYQLLFSQCSTWKQKYYQVNQQLLLQQQLNQNNQTQLFQIGMLREQNQRLNQKIKQLMIMINKNNQNNNNNQKNIIIKDVMEKLIEKYRDSLMKQCELVVERFRLEIKKKQK